MDTCAGCKWFLVMAAAGPAAKAIADGAAVVIGGAEGATPDELATAAAAPAGLCRGNPVGVGGVYPVVPASNPSCRVFTLAE